jgi:hypothetical protein
VLLRAIEQHEAFRQEVSEIASSALAMYKRGGEGDCMTAQSLHRFIIPAPKPDPLAEMLEKDFGGYMPDADDFRAALEARGLEIREKNND